MKKLILLSLLLTPISKLIGQMPETDIWQFNIHSPTESGREEVFTFTTGRNVTNRPGYDNQPYYTSSGLMWTSVLDSGETDIYELKGKVIERVTKTNISEYSPQLIPGTKFMTCVVVEKDSTQRLWKYDESKIDSLHAKTEILFPDLNGVAYYRWLNDSIVFIADLPEPMSLYIGNLKTGATKKTADNIGRSFGACNGDIFYTTQDSAGNYWIHAMNDRGYNVISDFYPIDCIPGSQDFAVMNNGTIFMATGTKLFCRWPDTNEWKLQHDFAADGLHKITRIAISPDGKFIALTDNL